MHAKLMGYVWLREKKENNALMLTELGSKWLAADNYRINEDAENKKQDHCCKHMHVNILKRMHA